MSEGDKRRTRTWQGVFQNGDLRARAELSTVAPRFGANRSEESCSRRASHNDTQTQLPAQDFAEKRHPNAVVRSTAQIIFVRLPFGTPDERQNPQARHLFPHGAHTLNGIRCPASTRKRQGRFFQRRIPEAPRKRRRRRIAHRSANAKRENARRDRGGRFCEEKEGAQKERSQKASAYPNPKKTFG